MQPKIELLSNPVSDYATLVNIEQPVTIALVDNLGRTVETTMQNKSSTVTINLSHYAAGMYYLQISGRDSKLTLVVAKIK